MEIKELFREIKYPIGLFDKNGNQIYYLTEDGYWWKREFDSNGNVIYYENSLGEYSKSEYDNNGNEVYLECEDGIVIDNRTKVKKDLI